MDRIYIAIDLKSFYASVECVERKLNPLTTNLVVADESKTEKTICLAVSPSLKAYGISGRARLFEVVEAVRRVNNTRLKNASGGKFKGESFDDRELKLDPSLKLGYIAAVPRMGLYMQYSKKIYKIYLDFVSSDDIHDYSIDEVFIDITSYLKIYKTTPRRLASDIVKEVFNKTGITATVGIGTNLFLCKVAMDIVAKHLPPDENGVRIAELDEMSYRRELWNHLPLTDFWRIGSGYANKLNYYGIKTMGDIARYSVTNEDFLYKLFGINAELLIDHAWGWEPCTIKDIKEYKPSYNSISSGQVLPMPYDFDKGKLIVREMTYLLVLDLVEKGLKTRQMVLTVGYDIENLADKSRKENYNGEIVVDRYGRKLPKQAHGSVNLDGYTSSARQIIAAVTELYDKIVDRNLLVRRMYVVANYVISESEADIQPQQLDFFNLADGFSENVNQPEKYEDKERKVIKTVISVHKKYGKNALISGMNLKEGSTAIQRNNQIGGHKK